MAKTFFVASSGWDEELNLSIETDLIQPLAEDIRDDAKRLCPEDSGDLAESIDITYIPGGARIGTDMDYALATELGSGPHPIRATGAKVLANKETGEFFGKQVTHPGTPEQPFLRPALYTDRNI
jgi:hypothetical protein